MSEGLAEASVREHVQLWPRAAGDPMASVSARPAHHCPQPMSLQHGCTAECPSYIS